MIITRQGQQKSIRTTIDTLGLTDASRAPLHVTTYNLPRTGDLETAIRLLEENEIDYETLRRLRGGGRKRSGNRPKALYEHAAATWGPQETVTNGEVRDACCLALRAGRMEGHEVLAITTSAPNDETRADIFMARMTATGHIKLRGVKTGRFDERCRRLVALWKNPAYTAARHAGIDERPPAERVESIRLVESMRAAQRELRRSITRSGRTHRGPAAFEITRQGQHRSIRQALEALGASEANRDTFQVTPWNLRTGGDLGLAIGLLEDQETDYETKRRLQAGAEQRSADRPRALYEYVTATWGPNEPVTNGEVRDACAIAGMAGGLEEHKALAITRGRPNGEARADILISRITPAGQVAKWLDTAAFDKRCKRLVAMWKSRDATRAHRAALDQRPPAGLLKKMREEPRRLRRRGQGQGDHDGASPPPRPRGRGPGA